MNMISLEKLKETVLEASELDSTFPARRGIQT